MTNKVYCACGLQLVAGLEADAGQIWWTCTCGRCWVQGSPDQPIVEFCPGS